jgi:hypothetical protein
MRWYGLSTTGAKTAAESAQKKPQTISSWIKSTINKKDVAGGIKTLIVSKDIEPTKPW